MGDPKNWCCLWMRPRDMAKIGQLVLDRGRWNGGQVVSETWINAATAPQIKTIYRGLDYGFQFWLGASFVSGKRIDWVEAQGQGGQRIFIVPTLDLVTVVTAGNYYGNDRLANLVPQIVFDDYVLPAVDAVRWLLRCHRERLLRVDPSDAGGPANRRLRRDGCGHAWTPRRDFAVSKSVTQYLTVGSVACQKAGAHRVTLCADPVRARHGPTGGPARVASAREPRSPRGAGAASIGQFLH
jgi:hypothetical protein